MNQKAIPKPIKRSRIRLFLGKRYFSMKRHMLWLFGGIKFSKLSEPMLPFICFSHETPLLRELKGVDMRLQHNKIVNLRIAASRVSGATLCPGETFSYWKLVGKPSKRKGYLKGMVLRNGVITDGTGGGICQLSNLIYWMAVHTSLTIVERHRHGYDVFPGANRTQPFGSGATCFYNYGDLMIRNDTDKTYRLVIEISDTHLKGAWTSDKRPEYTYEVYEREHVIQQEFWGGYTRHNLLRRKIYDYSGRVVDDEFVVENHAIMMYSPFLPENIK